MSDCSVNELRFDQLLQIPAGQCQQYISASSCSVGLTFEYHKQKYSARFQHSLVSWDYIYITSGPYLSYDIHYLCSKETKCTLQYAQKRVNEMVNRAYNVTRIYGQLAPFLENPLRNDSIQCYNIYNEISMCPPKQVCSMEYDQRVNKIKSRGCESRVTPRIYVHDGESDSYFHIECDSDLCNTDETYLEIRKIFAHNDLTDINGRFIAAGTKNMICTLFIIFALLFVIVF
ncbi:unnamed protein product [Adineta steineri]|uniref:Uncharacterized protein n=1 Tax=Adineta steineri TaxID=433720 RepID=A0A815MQ63_9BILA|nr:unnamed protein product [Adineta steineri]CAF3926231.1 unnamed protein product [Adineta steineri]